MKDSTDYRAMYEAEKMKADGLAKRLTGVTANSPNEKILRALLHDIRNNIGNIPAAIDIVNMHVSPTHDPEIFSLDRSGMEYLPLIRESSSRALDMAQEYLELARMEMGTYELEPRRFNLIRTVYEAGNEVMQKAKKSVKLFYRTSDIGNVEDFSEFSGEELKIRNCLHNLIQNGYDAAPENTNIYVSLGSQSDKLFIEVLNNGTIPSSLRDPEKLFAFGATSGKKRGNGIGTYTARLFARVHGGDITFKTSDATNSTSFRIELPKQKPRIDID